MCATLSSTESEYVVATKAGEGHRLRFLLAEFRQLDAETLTVLRVDNKSAITIAEGMGLTGNLKHMERRQAWLQHMVKRGKFSLKYIPTAEQPGDFLALHYPAFNRCSVAIGQGSRAFVHDTSSGAIPCVLLGFPPDEPNWQFYHPTSHRVLPSKDVTFDKLVSSYRLFPYHTAPLPPPPPFLTPGPPPIDPLPPQGPAPSSVSQVDPLPLAEPVEVIVDSGAARGVASGGAEPTGAEPGGAEPESAEPGGAEL
ncbi:unnamed protein product [Closterium sp. NIES-53]